MDFKQKIKIGLSPRQVGPEFYDQKEVTCLGIKKMNLILNFCVQFY